MGSNDSNVASPRLWYRDDLANHPELIPLEGQTIDYKFAGRLPTVYTGSVLLSTPLTKLSNGYFVNDTIGMKVDKFDGLYSPTALFNEPMSTENISHVADQWLTGDANTSAIHTVQVKFAEPQVLTEYWMMAAIGTKDIIDAERPSPRHWLVYGSDDNEQWDIICEQSEDADNWGYWNLRTYKIHHARAYKYIKIVITAWYAVENKTLSTGLKRLYLFGRPADKFILPNIQSPDDAFVWVVPYRETN
jgi:hypothetical protein